MRSLTKHHAGWISLRCSSISLGTNGFASNKRYCEFKKADRRLLRRLARNIIGSTSYEFYNEDNVLRHKNFPC